MPSSGFILGDMLSVAELPAVQDCARFCRHCGGVLVRGVWCADCQADQFSLCAPEGDV